MADLLENEGSKKVKSRDYDHSHYKIRRDILRFLLQYVGIPLLAKVEAVEGNDHIPVSGPAILMINHIALIDPIIILPFITRSIVPLAKVEVYNYPIVGILPHIWGVIPVRREEVDRRAIQLSLDVLRAGEIILVAPEGTRGPSLKQGKEGIAYLASRSGAPIVPVAVDGTEGFPALRGTRRWHAKGVRVQFGRAFRYRQQYRHASGEVLRQMTDEAMYVLSALLPPERRGFYGDLTNASQITIEMF